MSKYTIDTTTTETAIAGYGKALKLVNGRREKVNADEQAYSLGLTVYLAAFTEARGCPISKGKGHSPKGLAECRDEAMGLAGYAKFNGSFQRAWNLSQKARKHEATADVAADPAAFTAWLEAEGIETFGALKALVDPSEPVDVMVRIADLLADAGYRTKEECAEALLKNAAFGKRLRERVAEGDAKAEAKAKQAEARKADTQAKADARRAEKALAKAIAAMEAAGLDASALKVA